MTTRTFTETDARVILKTWAKDKGYSIYNISEFTQWSYKPEPFYTTIANVSTGKGYFPCGFHIHANGEVLIIPLEPQEVFTK